MALAGRVLPCGTLAARCLPATTGPGTGTVQGGARVTPHLDLGALAQRCPNLKEQSVHQEACSNEHSD